MSTPDHDALHLSLADKDTFQHWYLNQIVHALVKAIGLRDGYTAQHLMNVSQLGRAIAQAMGLSRDQIECVRLAGVLHDIGNMGIPLEILLKERRLNPAEEGLVREHPKIAYEILSEPDFPIDVAEVVYQHHERLDGSGYPRGLKAGAIKLAAQVVAVADVFDTIVSRRPYKDAAGSQVALDELQQHAGVLYNAEAVDACVRLMRKGEVPQPFCADRYERLRKQYEYGVNSDARA